MSGPLPRIEPVQLARPGTLARELLSGSEATAGLLPVAPGGAEPSAAGRAGGGAGSPGAGSRRARNPHPGPVRLDASALGTTTPEARAKLQRILGGDGFLVSTGQQPVLFLGPLYVLYKAIGAIELARRLEAELGLPVLAMFWIASDDHDWAEVGTTHLVDVANHLRSFVLGPGEGRAGRPVGPSPLSGDVLPLLDDFAASLLRSRFSAGCLDFLRRAYRPERSFAEAFAAALAGLLGGRDLVWLDAAAPEVKTASRELFRRAVRESEADEEALARGTAAVERSGFPPQLALLPGASQLFMDTPEGRERIYREDADGDFRLGRGGSAVALTRLMDEISSRPAFFSPGAAFRPVLESWLLPVGATVLGPGEIAYWAQLGPLFERYRVPVPEVHPRPAWRVLEGKVERVLDGLGVEPEQLADGGAAYVRREVERRRPPAVERALTGVGESLATGMAGVEAAVDRDLPGVRASAGRARSEISTALERLRRSVDRRVRDDAEAASAQIRKAAAHLFPDGVPQERWLNPFYYLARYGSAFVDEVERHTRLIDRSEPAG